MQKQIVGLMLVGFFLALAWVFLNKQSGHSMADAVLLSKPLIAYDLYAPSNVNPSSQSSIGDNNGANNSANNSQEVISNIVFYRNGKAQLNAFQADGEWLSSHLSVDTPYPLQIEPLTRFIRDLLDANIIENKSAKPKNHARLGLLGQDIENATSMLVEITTNRHKIKLLLGKPAQLSNGQYVRFNDKDQMLLIDKLLVVPEHAYAWLNPALFDLDLNQIVRITRLNTAREASSTKPKITGYQWQITRDAENFLVLQGLNAGDDLAYEGILSNYLATIGALSFDEVQSRQALPESDVLETSKPETNTLLFALEIETVDSRTNISFTHRLSLLQKKTPESNVILQIDGSGKHMRFNDWQYMIPQYQIEELLKSKQDFLANP